MFGNSKYISAHFLKVLTYEPSKLRSRTLNVHFLQPHGAILIEESLPIIIPYEYIQPVEIPPLENSHGTYFSHNFHNLIQNTQHKISVTAEHIEIIKALELLWPLLRNLSVAKLITQSLTIET